MPAAAIRREKGAIVSEVVLGRYAGLRRGASRGGDAIFPSSGN